MQNESCEQSCEQAAPRQRNGREKRNSPLHPLIEKREGKETIPVYISHGFQDRAGAHTRTRGGRLPCTCTHEEAGHAALEIIDNCFGTTKKDFRIWAWYCRHFDRQLIVNKAYDYASRQRQGDLDDAVTAFQAWLQDTFKNPKPESEGGAK